MTKVFFVAESLRGYAASSHAVISSHEAYPDPLPYIGSYVNIASSIYVVGDIIYAEAYMAILCHEIDDPQNYRFQNIYDEIAKLDG